MSGLRVVLGAGVSGGVLSAYDLLAVDRGVFGAAPIPVQLHTVLVVGLAVAVTSAGIRQLVMEMRRFQDAVARAGERGFELGRRYEAGARGLSLVKTAGDVEE